MPASTALPVRSTLPKVTLLLDVGNTRVKLGWVDVSGHQRETNALALNHNNTAALILWLAQQAIHPVAALGVNVAGSQMAQNLDALLQEHYGFTVNWVSSQPYAAGIRNNYLDHKQLGADRWLAMVGLTRYQDASNRQPMMLVSFGTATTIDTLVPDAISGDSNQAWIFIGGLILPGLELMRASLVQGTANLPSTQGQAVAFPQSTQQAINSGIAAAQAGAVERQWQAVLTQYGVPPRLFSTGGAWPELEVETQALLAASELAQSLPASPIQWLAAPVLDGLAQLAISPS